MNNITERPAEEIKKEIDRILDAENKKTKTTPKTQ